MSQIAIVYITAPNKEDGRRIATHLLEHKLVACVNMVEAESAYLWDKQIENGHEVLLLAKTRLENIPRVRQEVLAQHPYDTPCVLTASVEANETYASYVKEYAISIED